MKIKQSTRWLKCIGPKGEIEKLMPNMPDIVINMSRKDLLQQWKIQNKILSASEAGQKIQLSS